MRRDISVPVGLLVLSLAVVVLLGYYLRAFERQSAVLRGQQPAIPSEPVVTVHGHHFFDTVDGFRFRVPPEGWQMRALTRPEILPPEDPARSVLDNMATLAVAYRVAAKDTVAMVTAGLVKQTLPRDAYDCAVQALGELIARYERGPTRVRLLKEVTRTGAGVDASAYFMVVLPPEAQESMPVWIVSASVREPLACLFLARTTEAFYPSARTDIERIMESFRWLEVKGGGAN